MDLLVDVLLLLAAAMLVVRSNSDRDEVWALCLRILAAMSVLAVITSTRGQPVALLLMLLARVRPGAGRVVTPPPPPGPAVPWGGGGGRRSGGWPVCSVPSTRGAPGATVRGSGLGSAHGRGANSSPFSMHSPFLKTSLAEKRGFTTTS